VVSEEPPPDRVETQFLADASRTVISTNTSPDIPFDASLNPYRGCEHGCGYCYARPTHEYLGFSAGLDFETRILVKQEAPELLRRELAKPSWTPKPLALSGVTDPYQPVERKLELTRRCLEVLAEARHPVMVITKNALVTRDADLLTRLARHRAAVVWISIATPDGELARRLEPRASHPRERFKAMEKLTAAGVPVGVLMAPIIPGLTEHHLPELAAAASAAGVTFARYTMLRLPGAVKDVFLAWLDEHVPERKEKVLSKIRSMRGGRLNDSRFGHRFHAEGVFAEQIRALFHTTCRREGLEPSWVPELSTEAFRRPGAQLGLF
jgi:DNA repair photolyase